MFDEIIHRSSQKDCHCHARWLIHRSSQKDCHCHARWLIHRSSQKDCHCHARWLIHRSSQNDCHCHVRWRCFFVHFPGGCIDVKRNYRIHSITSLHIIVMFSLRVRRGNLIWCSLKDAIPHFQLDYRFIIFPRYTISGLAVFHYLHLNHAYRVEWECICFHYILIL